MKSSIGMKIFVIATLAFFVALIGLPLLIMVSVSLKTMQEVNAPAFSIWPQSWQFVNYARAMAHGNWGRYLFNSIYVTAITVVISLVINSMAGYAFARIPFRGRNVLFALLLVGMMIPPQVTMLPVFLMLRGFPLAGGNNILGQGGRGLLNTYAGLILPYIAGSFGVFLTRQFFGTFPKELDDAARMDGCGRFSAYTRIYLPLSKPVMATLSILKFTGTWNEYTWPSVMTFSDNMKTVQIALSSFRDEAVIYWNELMAATIISTLFIFVIFLLMQSYFISGMLAGSVNE